MDVSKHQKIYDQENFLSPKSGDSPVTSFQRTSKLFSRCQGEKDFDDNKWARGRFFIIERRTGAAEKSFDKKNEAQAESIFSGAGLVTRIKSC